MERHSKKQSKRLQDIVKSGNTTDFYGFILDNPLLKSESILVRIAAIRDWLPGLAVLQDSVDIDKSLVICARHDRLEMVKRCLELGAKPIPDVLIKAACNDCIMVCKHFYESGYDVHFDREKMLSAALFSRSERVSVWLCGLPETNVNARGGYILESAVNARNIALFDAVMARKPDAVINGFLCAVDTRNLIAMERLLEYRPWLVNCESGQPLRLSVYKRDDVMTQMLLMAGADPDLVTTESGRAYLREFTK